MRGEKGEVWGEGSGRTKEKGQREGQGTTKELEGELVLNVDGGEGE